MKLFQMKPYHFLATSVIWAGSVCITLAETHTVAFDDLGDSKKSLHLQSGSLYQWPDSVPASVKDRNIAFGKTVSLSYVQAKPGARYAAKIILSSDHERREASISIDGQQVKTGITIEPNSEKVITLKIPQSAISDGHFELDVIAGEKSSNAAVSSVTITSTSPQALVAVIPSYGAENIQYTPIPHSMKAGPRWQQSLNGTWKFLAKAPDSFSAITPNKSWNNIEVPGQWINQGFDIPADQATAYFHQFNLPENWKGRLIKLRFDSVFSDCEVFVNGKSVGKHTGGFTPFELDVTKAVTAGQNTLALRVTSWSLADQMASASKYACHPLGGISRDVTLFSVPQTHLKDVFIQTDFDEKFHDAELHLTLDIAGKKSSPVQITLWDHDSQEVFKMSKNFTLGTQEIKLPISQPKHWTPETPYLYTLEITVGDSVTRHAVGFREIEITKSQILVNGSPVKLRGINRHEAHPLRGRSLPEGQWEQDLLLFRDANVNLIRTCHYPPALHLGTAGDQHGMWLEIEGPFCWEKGSNNKDHLNLTVRQLAEMVKAWRNHPSVLYWSIANESAWGKNFVQASKVMRQLDPTRPQTFNWMTPRLSRADEAQCELGNIHYPGFNGKPTAEKYSERPLMFGEYAHLNAYNRRELMSDPGLRDIWGKPLAAMWETMWNEPSIVGGAIWSGIDDTFFLKDDVTVGYGAWGPLDPWRRPKPEHWHMKKIYSPIHIINRHQPTIDQSSLTLQAENRGDFLNFNQLTFTWKHGSQTGTVEPNISARAKGSIRIGPPNGVKAGTPISLSVTHPLGYEIDRFVFPTSKVSIAPIATGMPQLIATDAHFILKQGKSTYQIDRKTGAFSSKYGEAVTIKHGPHLLLTPLNKEGNTQMKGKTKHFQAYYQIGTEWKNQAPVVQQNSESIVIKIPCSYREAAGSYTFTFSKDKPVLLQYEFTMKVGINPRQLGICFDLPHALNELSWQRTGQWTAYPDDHIGRLNGSAKMRYGKSPDVTEIGPRQQPTVPWSQDNTAFGSNDFRASKKNIQQVRISSGNAALEIRLTQQPCHFQALVDATQTKAFILGYTNAGHERFLQRLVNRDYRPLNPGSKLKGSFYLQSSAR